MNIYLIRHGEKAGRTENIAAMELTEKGFRQANLLGKRLADYGIEIIFSSDMTRAIQTSEEANKYLGVKIEIRKQLREIDMKEVDEKGWDYVFKTYPDFKAKFEKHKEDVPYPNGECGGDVWNRAKEVLDEIVGLGLENVAIVAHAGLIRPLICGALNLPQARRFYFGRNIEHCSISILKYEKNNFYLHTFNDYQHLGEEI